MKKIYSILIILICFGGFSQELELNYTALEDGVLELMNEHRKTLTLDILEKDIVLQKAAQDQSNYMLAIKKLAHEQPTANKKYPKNRIHFYGGTNFSNYGENVLYLTIETQTYSKKEIADLAKKIYLEWATSPPHYKNITTKEFKYANVAFAYDSKSKRLYATTVFGNKTNE